jgi:hypothetical protein
MPDVTQNEVTNDIHDAVVHVRLSFAALFQLLLRNVQRVIAAFDDVQFIDRAHFASDLVQQIQRA